jgi:hypothetical protein
MTYCTQLHFTATNLRTAWTNFNRLIAILIEDANAKYRRPIIGH